MNKLNVPKFRLSFIVVVLLLMTSLSFVFMTGTMAKFSIIESSSETSRVSKWGITITGEGATDGYIFAKNYYEGEKSNTPDGTYLVATSSDDNTVIAPATSNTFSIYVSGKAEVRTALSFASNETMFIGDWVDRSGDPYEPIVWTVTQASEGRDAVYILREGTLAEFKSTMESTTKTFEPNEEVNEVFTITWTWKTLANDMPGYDEQNDKDSYLVKKTPAVGIRFNLVTTMVQIIA